MIFSKPDSTRGVSAVKAGTQEGVPYRELFSFPLFLSHPCPAFPGLFLTLVIILPLSLSVTAPQPLFWLGEVLSLTGLTYLPSPWIPTLSLPVSCTPHPFEVTAHAVWAAGLPHLKHLSLLRESFPLQSNRFPAWNHRDFQQATPQGFGMSFPLLLHPARLWPASRVPPWTWECGEDSGADRGFLMGVRIGAGSIRAMMLHQEPPPACLPPARVAYALWLAE